MTTNDKKIQNYQQGAAECLAMQRKMTAAGNHHTAAGYAKAVDANLDAINKLKGRG